MKQMIKLKPSFWDHADTAAVGQGVYGFSFKRKWKLLVIFTSFMALLPLIVMSYVEFSLTKRIIETQVQEAQDGMLQSIVSALQLHPNIINTDPEEIIHFIRKINTDSKQDFFIIDETGLLKTDSVFYGTAGKKIPHAALQHNNAEKTLRSETPEGTRLLLSIEPIRNTPISIISARKQAEVKELWLKPRLKLVWYLILSIFIILLSIMGLSTYLVGRIHLADNKRAQAIHHAEYANRLASIGRLASGVAHEINNPLAIINQKTGLMTDLLALNEALGDDGRMEQLAEDVHEAVRRCSAITRRLQDFARHMEPSIEMVDVPEVISQVIGFLEQEAAKRDIHVNFQVKTPPPVFECDKGSMQQIFLNLLDNAFTAMQNGGQLDIIANYRRKKILEITIADNGIGISDEDIAKIFEPFYASKNGHWGTGLGLSITFSLVKELGGEITIKSEIHKGTTVTLKFPVTAQEKPSNE